MLVFIVFFSEKHLSALLKLKANLSKGDRRTVKETLSDALRETSGDGSRPFFSKVQVKTCFILFKRWVAQINVRRRLCVRFVKVRRTNCSRDRQRLGPDWFNYDSVRESIKGGKNILTSCLICSKEIASFVLEELARLEIWLSCNSMTHFSDMISSFSSICP